LCAITNPRRIQIKQNRTFGPYLAAINRTFISIMDGHVVHERPSAQQIQGVIAVRGRRGCDFWMKFY
jgi:hypothetical protein